jgi:hypothetical protein
MRSQFAPAPRVCAGLTTLSLILWLWTVFTGNSPFFLGG